MVAVGEDCVRHAVGGDAGDDRPEIAYVAGEDLDVRADGAVCLGLVGEQGDVEAEPTGCGEEPFGDRVGRVEGKQVQLHEGFTSAREVGPSEATQILLGHERKA